MYVRSEFEIGLSMYQKNNQYYESCASAPLTLCSNIVGYMAWPSIGSNDTWFSRTSRATSKTALSIEAVKARKAAKCKYTALDCVFSVLPSHADQCRCVDLRFAGLPKRPTVCWRLSRRCSKRALSIFQLMGQTAFGLATCVPVPEGLLHAQCE